MSDIERERDERGHHKVFASGRAVPSMDEQQLQDAEARAKSATPGEWWMSSEVKEDDAAVWGPDGDAIAEKVGGNLTLGGTGNDNAAFIAHARADVPALIAEVRRLQQQAEGQPVLKTEWQRLESARDAALAERDAAVVRFHDWSGTDVPALNIALTAARQDAHEQRQRAEQAEAALTEARRVLRDIDTTWALHGISPELQSRIAAVLAQEEK
jgi:hypothetical protein